MAYDKVVDSAELDAGMTATANAIREKTGSTDPIMWDASNGFKTAVEGIETGGVSEQESLVKFLGGYLPEDLVLEGVTIQSGTDCCKIKTLKLINCTMINYSTFKGSTVEHAEVIGGSVNNYLFENCVNLKTVKYNQWGTQGGLFFKCTSLEWADMGPDFYYIGVYFAVNASNLKTLILRRNKVTEYAHANAFTGSPFAIGGTGGNVYVPSVLIEQYQQATNWSALYEAGTCIFRALEDYTIDGTTTGEMDWAKIEGGTA